jgi:hypothetical protein
VFAHGHYPQLVRVAVDDESYSATGWQPDSFLPFALNFFMLAGVKRLRIVVPVLLAMVAALWWIAVRQDPAHIFTLPDGSHLYFRGVTLGSNVQVNLGSPVEKMLGHLPGKWGWKFRRNVWEDENTEETLVFWFEFERAPSTNLLVEVMFKDPAQRFITRPRSWLPAQTLPNGRIVASCGKSVWPREEKAWVVWIGTEEDEPKALRISTPNGDEFVDKPGEFKELGELSVKNPGYKPKAGAGP